MSTPKIIEFPGLVDVHVHFREPGFEQKETIRTGSLAAARGGYTVVCPMPNICPVPDTIEHLNAELSLIERNAAVRVLPYASITLGRKGEEVVDMKSLAPCVVGFSDDGTPVGDSSVMEEAMRQAARLDCLIVEHSEDVTYPPEDPRSEWMAVERNCGLALKTGCRLHICHVSCAKSVEAIRKARRAGAKVTCETAPHYILLSQDDWIPGGRFTMNPPLRSASDRDALIEGILDGTIEVIATDHAPHTAMDKAAGANGIVGLETAFPVLYTALVLGGVISLEKLIDLMSEAPRRIFRIEEEGDSAFFDLSTPWNIDSSTFLSKGRFSPFDGWEVRGRCVKTVCGGKIVWEAEK